MARIVALELLELDLPFRQRFKHAAAERIVSSSVFMRCVTEGGHEGYGETLPRRYVTGEDRETTFDLLAEQIVPHILNLEFADFDEVIGFLNRCDGKAPPEWVDPSLPQTAAWCLADLALLDAFGRTFGVSVGAALGDGAGGWADRFRYSLVLSGESTRRTLVTLAKAKLYGLRSVKAKVEGDSVSAVRLARRVLGHRASLRVDTNMAWDVDTARVMMPRLARLGVESFEQPLPADDLDGMAMLLEETGLEVMADESIHDAASLERLIARRACTAVNIRIAKCGGLVASLARCRRALDAGLTLQVGCQVGETSQLSAAQLVLLSVLGGEVHYAEGCFGERLLQIDPVEPVLQFGREGQPPQIPPGAGFGTRANMDLIRSHAGRRIILGSMPPTQRQGTP